MICSLINGEVNLHINDHSPLLVSGVIVSPVYKEFCSQLTLDDDDDDDMRLH